MYRGFELRGFKTDFFNGRYASYLKIGREILNKQKDEVEHTLNSFVSFDGSLDGDRMQSAWFPQIKADIFLSHSHKDEKLVIAFAGWLKEKFELDVFIDSCVWKYSMDLQKIIDKDYSINDGKLIYNKVLYASSHVHMMLNTALMQMIDNCECIMFINTPNSVKPHEVVNRVVSPWIYSELGMTKLIKRKSANAHRDSRLTESLECFSEKFSIRYNLGTDHLTKLNPNDLNDWEREIPKFKTLTFAYSHEALDTLYKIKPLDIA